MVQILNHYNSKHSLVNKTILGLFFIILLFSIQGKAEAQDAPAAPEITGSISGRVTDQDGQPLAGISVSAYRNTIYFYKDTKTDASGNYRLDGLTTGLYVIEFSDESTQYISQYYKAPQSLYTAQEISVVGNDILGIDAALIKSAKISGKVSVLAGVGAGMVDVNLYRFNENNVDWYSHKYTRISAKEGEETPFLLDQLESGRYRIRVEPTFTDLPDEYYDNSLTLENATDISLTTGAEITGITVILGENPNTADIHGKVTDASGLPLPDIEVTAYLSGSYYLDSVRTTRTTQDGTYAFRQLAPDDYLVYFREGTGKFATEYYDDARTSASATPLHLITGTIQTGIDAQLEQTGSISGVVRFFDGSSPYYAHLNIYSASNQYAEPIDTDYAYAIDGVLRYKINQLAVGSYRIAARASFFGTDIEEFYSDAQTVELAKDVVVKPGETTADINFILGDVTSASVISGNVRSIDNTPLADIQVTAFLSDSTYYNTSYTQTNSQGNYQLYLTQPGEYIVEFYDTSQSFHRQYYNNVITREMAIPLQVITGSALSNINAILAPMASISGTIAMFNGVAPSVVYVSLYKADGSYWEKLDYMYLTHYQKSSALNYWFKGLNAGIYRVSAELVYASDDFAEFYNDQPTLDSATNITLSDGVAITDVNFVMGQDLANATIAGKVVTNGSIPSNLRIDLYKLDSYSRLLVYLTPNADGSFKIAGLNEGEYLIAMRFGEGYYASRFYWPNTTKEEEATTITLSNTTTFSDVSFTIYQAYLPIISNQSSGR